MQPEIRHLNPDAAYYFAGEGCYINELSNCPEDPAVSIAEARVAPGQTTRWHRLAGITERYVVLSGRGSVNIGDLRPEVVEAGAIVMIPPGCRQRISNIGNDPLVFLAICTPRFEQDVYEPADDNVPATSAT